MQFKFIIGLIGAIIITIFAINNAAVVQVNILFHSFQMSQAVIIFVSAAIGAIAISLIGSTKYYRLSLERKQLKKDIEKLMEENKLYISRINDLTKDKSGKDIKEKNRLVTESLGQGEQNEFKREN